MNWLMIGGIIIAIVVSFFVGSLAFSILTKVLSDKKKLLYVSSEEIKNYVSIIGLNKKGQLEVLYTLVNARVEFVGLEQIIESYYKREKGKFIV